MSVGPPTNAEIYGKYADDLVRFATGLVGPSDAQDVVSAAVIKVMWSKRWDDVTNYKAYLYQAVLNESRMHHRSTMRRRAREQRASGSDIVYPKEVRPEVLEAVGKLSPQQRAAVFLTYWEGLGVDEVAFRLGVREGSVKRHLARARAKLRGALDA
ncbi:MAG: sigma-70 family RNA polymerase sigma factor [bacterium]|nr:sigma-70 family RNA polymerase sigma factor [bacterium]